MICKSTLCIFCVAKCNETCYTCINKTLLTRCAGQKFDLSLLDAVKNMHKYRNIIITGGEPGLLQYSEKISLVNYIKDRTNSLIELHSNGTNLEHWPNGLKKTIHICHERSKIVVDDDIYTYSIVTNRRANLEYFVNVINTMKEKRFYILNDHIEPISTEDFSNFMHKLTNKNITVCNNNEFTSTFFNNILDDTYLNKILTVGKGVSRLNVNVKCVR